MFVDRILQRKKAGVKGGHAVAVKHGQEFCDIRAQKGGQTCLERYGREYYKAIRKLRKD